MITTNIYVTFYQMSCFHSRSFIYSFIQEIFFEYLSQGICSVLEQATRVPASCCLVSANADKWKQSLCMGHLSWDVINQQESF